MYLPGALQLWPVRGDASLSQKPRSLRTTPGPAPHASLCPLGNPPPLRSRQPRVVPGMDQGSPWGHRLLSPEIWYLLPALGPALSGELPALPSPCSPDPGGSLGDRRAALQHVPDSVRYAFFFLQHVVKFITPGNDFLTVLGKEREREKKKRPLKKNEPWQAWTPFVTIWKLIVESEEYFVVCLAVPGTNSREH